MSPLDVLSVMQDGIADYTESGHEGLASDMTEAHNAVAELIEAATDATEERMHDGASSRAACDRLVAALARVSGGAA